VPMHTSRPASPERPIIIEQTPEPTAEPRLAATPSTTTAARMPDRERTERPLHDPSREQRESYHVGAILICSALVLLPGVMARLAPERWAGLPDAVRWAAYAGSALLTVATCLLLLRPRRA
jgi:hypothetical protein